VGYDGCSAGDMARRRGIAGAGSCAAPCRRGGSGRGHGSADGDRANQGWEAGQKIIHADEQELKDLEQSLQDPNVKLADQARQEKEEQLRGKMEAFQRRLQEFNREVQQKQREMVVEYAQKIAAAAQAVGQKEGYTAILDKGNEALIRIVLYHQPALDVTDSIIKEFDRQNP
jgi:outer membrane protein